MSCEFINFLEVHYVAGKTSGRLINFERMDVVKALTPRVVFARDGSGLKKIGIYILWILWQD